MEMLNAFGQPVGPAVTTELPRPRPRPVTLEGRYIRVVPLRADHAEALYDRLGGADRAPLWTYIPTGPYTSLEAFADWVASAAASPDAVFFALEDLVADRPLGFCSLMRIDPQMGVVEIGFILFSKALQSTAAATEAMALIMGHVFDDLGYRRYEWKCDALNAPSRRAAERLGFRHEGTFRQAVVYKGRNRDTAWFSVIDRDWPRLRQGFRLWLDEANFDAMGRQIRRLEACRSPEVEDI